MNDSETKNRSKLVQLQHILMNLKADKLQHATRRIISENLFLSTDSFINNVLLTCNYRPSLLNRLAMLAELISHENIDIKNSILKCCFRSTDEQNESLFYPKSVDFRYLRACMDLGIVQFLDILNQIRLYQEHYPSHTIFFIALFFWFAPEIEINAPALYQSLYSTFSEQMIRKYRPYYLSEFYSNFASYKQNNWSLLHEVIKNGHTINSLAHCLKNDDVEELMSYSTNFHFDFNQLIKPSVFEPFDMIHEGAPLIHYSAYFGSLKCFKYLYLNGSNLNIKNDEGKTLAHFAVAGGNLEIIRLIEQSNCSFDGALQIAALYHRNKIFNWLLETKTQDITSIHPKFGTVFHQASISNNVELLDYFEQGIDPNIPDSHHRSPLHQAVISNNSESIHNLLDIKGVDPNLRDENGRTPFHLAVYGSTADIIDEFVHKDNLDINASTADGKTPLHILAGYDRYNSLHLLLQSDDININGKDREGNTPLHIVAKLGRLQATEQLLNVNDIDVNNQNNAGNTPLHLATIEGNINVVRKILAIPEASTNIPNKEGNTVIHEIVGPNFRHPRQIMRSTILEILASKPGTDLNARNSKGETPLDIATREGLSHPISVLRELMNTQ